MGIDGADLIDDTTADTPNDADLASDTQVDGARSTAGP